MSGFAAKVHDTPMGKILAICDHELLGRRLTGRLGDVDVSLDLIAYREFYDSGVVLDEDEITELLSKNKMYVINAVGERIVNLLIDIGITRQEDVKLIGDVPHIQVYYIRKEE